MLPLDQDLQCLKNNLDDFAEITVHVLNPLTNVLSDSEIKGRYIIHSVAFLSHKLEIIFYLSPNNSRIVPVSDSEKF
jgi:hypothetical protein